jgi:hypothetical protein
VAVFWFDAGYVSKTNVCEKPGSHLGTLASWQCRALLCEQLVQYGAVFSAFAVVAVIVSLFVSASYSDAQRDSF